LGIKYDFPGFAAFVPEQQKKEKKVKAEGKKKAKK
jgi:hypothetical protein